MTVLPKDVWAAVFSPDFHWMTVERFTTIKGLVRFANLAKAPSEASPSRVAGNIDVRFQGKRERLQGTYYYSGEREMTGCMLVPASFQGSWLGRLPIWQKVENVKWSGLTSGRSMLYIFRRD